MNAARWRDLAVAIALGAVVLTAGVVYVIVEAVVIVLTGNRSKTPGEGRTGGPPRPALTGPPSPGPECRWCHGTGWATLIDPVAGDAYSVTCPGDCPPAGVTA